MDKKYCRYCGKEIKNRRNKYYCSHQCAGLARQNYKICVICGKKYKCPPVEQVQTCSKECSKKLRKLMYQKSQKVQAAAAKMQEAAKHSPNSGRFDTNVLAKTWVMRSPDGNVYEVSNLKNWCREHEALLPSKWECFYKGMQNIKRSQQGKVPYNHTQYQGWELIKYYDVNLARLKH